MKILVTGVTGLLGEAFSRLLSRSHEVVGVSRKDLDLSDLSAVEQFLRQQEFDVLVNPAGVTGLEQCLDEQSLAAVVNTEAPALMAKVCAEKGVRFVHFSTDYVFDGVEPVQMDEQWPPSPLNSYGVTKHHGEMGVLEYPEHLVCRVSWIFGAGRPTVIDQVVAKAVRGDELNYICDKWSIPTHSDAIVQAVEQMLRLNLSGLYHVCSDNEPVSWWQYADTVVGIAHELGYISERPTVTKGKLDDVTAFRAARPRHTAMSTRRLKAAGVEMPCWQASARQYLMDTRLTV